MKPPAVDPQPSSREDPQHRRLADLARTTPWFMRALRAARTLALDDWCIGAGAVRNLVWDALHGKASPSALADVDVTYFDEADCSPVTERRLLQRLRDLDPTLPWEVTNQAAVHVWFEQRFGHAVQPLRSLSEAVASWPEFATAVGLTLDADDAIRVIAPHGLADLFGMVVRRNPVRVSVETYRERVASKCYTDRWPMVQVVAC